MRLQSTPSQHVKKKHLTLTQRRNHSRSDALLFSPNGDLSRYTGLGREGHFDQRCDSAARYGLAEEFKGVCAVAERDVGSFDWLQGECGD